MFPIPFSSLPLSHTHTRRRYNRTQQQVKINLEMLKCQRSQKWENVSFTKDFNETSARTLSYLNSQLYLLLIRWKRSDVRKWKSQTKSLIAPESLYTFYQVFYPEKFRRRSIGGETFSDNELDFPFYLSPAPRFISGCCSIKCN